MRGPPRGHMPTLNCDNTPVCVLGLGLIGGSVMRAAKAAGREVFGYNRSMDGVEAARFDGFDATDGLDDVTGARRRPRR